jgi:hypothetical protein
MGGRWGSDQTVGVRVLLCSWGRVRDLLRQVMLCGFSDKRESVIGSGDVDKGG